MQKRARSVVRHRQREGSSRGSILVSDLLRRHQGPDIRLAVQPTPFGQARHNLVGGLRVAASRDRDEETNLLPRQ